MKYVLRLLLFGVLMVGTSLGSGPGGNDDEVQYKDGMSFAGAPGLKYDATTDATTAKLLNAVRYAHEYATGGEGTSSDPWTGWEGAIAADTRLHFPTGYYSTSNAAVSDLDGVRFTGDGLESTYILCTDATGDCLKVDNSGITSEGLQR